MTTLIDKVLLLIADPAAAAISRVQVQDALDRTRQAVRTLPLTPQPTRSSSALTWLDYFAGDPDNPIGDWETGEVLYDNTFTAITPSSSEEIVGHWAFSSDKPPPVYLTGNTYDVYRAAADLCEVRATILATAYDFSLDSSQRFMRSQQSKQFAALAAKYRLQARPRSGLLLRPDAGGGPPDPTAYDFWRYTHTQKELRR